MGGAAMEAAEGRVGEKVEPRLADATAAGDVPRRQLQQDLANNVLRY
jgi:hypothetical protein